MQSCLIWNSHFKCAGPRLLCVVLKCLGRAWKLQANLFSWPYAGTFVRYFFWTALPAYLFAVMFSLSLYLACLLTIWEMLAAAFGFSANKPASEALWNTVPHALLESQKMTTSWCPFLLVMNCLFCVIFSSNFVSLFMLFIFTFKILVVSAGREKRVVAGLATLKMLNCSWNDISIILPSRLIILSVESQLPEDRLLAPCVKSRVSISWYYRPCCLRTNDPTCKVRKAHQAGVCNWCKNE